MRVYGRGKRLSAAGKGFKLRFYKLQKKKNRFESDILRI